ncbi:MAG: ABC transporter substrate-binding protein [Bdellovibrionales bacterium]|nr:ABC transporter substrate-binding protein [Bdellovibrionales bacterium]
MLYRCFSPFLFLILTCCPSAWADKPQVTVGLGAVLSGDMAIFGQGDLRAVQTYLDSYGRHNIKLVVEDARLTSAEGLRAYQKLINYDKVDVLIAAGTSNGIMAAKGLVNSSQTVTFMASTGGKNIDEAGPWMFRLGNSDTLNGVQQAQYFIEQGITRVALLTELTEYTTDISKAFRAEFLAHGGALVYDDSFLPNPTDFRSQVTAILHKSPQAVFMPTQTGTALGIFLKQLRTQETEGKIEVHTTMVAAPNPNAHEIAGKHLLGVYYMDPNYDSEGERYQEFLARYTNRFHAQPAAPFHAASVVETLELLQLYLDKYMTYDKQGFQKYLLTEVGNRCGYMGCYQIDAEGNSDLGFHLAKITKLISSSSQ